MLQGSSWCLTKATDEELERGLRELLGKGARIEALVVAHLAEVEVRRLHLRAGYQSLYGYCLERLGFGDFEACLRIAAARLARRFPIIFDLLERREIHLTALRLLRDYLTPENHRELLVEASHQSKRQIELLLARRFPQPDTPTRLQKLPTLSPLSPDRFRLELTISGELKEKLELARDLLSHANRQGDLVMVLERGTDALLKQLLARKFGKSARRAGTAPQSVADTMQGSQVSPKVGVSPKEALEPQIRAESQRSDDVDPQPAVASSAAVPFLADQCEPADGVMDMAGSAERVPNEAKRAHIPQQLRRRILERDGLQCSYVSSEGQRCTARAWLQIHHEHAWARGGDECFENLKLLCAQHNRLLAERDFGEQHVATAIARRRSTTPLALAPCPDKVEKAS